MCGIAGFVSKNYSYQYESVLRRMGDAIRHRGPDAQGIYAFSKLNVGLVHQRLSILDLSPTGAQPMTSPDERYVICFNGEIYNYIEIKSELLKLNHKFRGESDTEVLLHAIEEWGLEATLKKCHGMFAFALLDKKDQTLSLARDRFGEKPLYYGWHKDHFIFASELKSFFSLDDWTGPLCRDSLSLFLKYNCIPSPWSIFKNIFKLPPGTFFTLKLSQDDRPSKPTHHSPLDSPQKYFDLLNDIQTSKSSYQVRSDNELISNLDSLLHKVIQRQLRSDVPVGAFLSGGIDSTTVVAIARANTRHRIKTFSIGFSEDEFNEAPYAAKIAQLLDTDHTELNVTTADAINFIPELPYFYDEPFADSSQIPTYLVAKLARQQVTVSLSGDGGDELFGGYNRYNLGYNIWNKISQMPQLASSIIGGTIRTLSPEQWNRFSKFVLPFLPASIRHGQLGEKLYRVENLLEQKDFLKFYKGLVSHVKMSSPLRQETSDLKINIDLLNKISSRWDVREQMMYLDLISYLPDDILTKVDRATMGVSLEGRIPFLDHELALFAWSLPLDKKIRHGSSKWILKQVLYKYVPESYFQRPKAGFAIPLASWLRAELKPWAEELLSPNSLNKHQLFNDKLVREQWAEHQSQAHNYQYNLWNYLMLQSWYNKYEKHISI